MPFTSVPDISGFGTVALADCEEPAISAATEAARGAIKVRFFIFFPQWIVHPWQKLPWCSFGCKRLTVLR